jgi:molybdopterin-guanine dinucleotide biosynthesis protein MobB
MLASAASVAMVKNAAHESLDSLVRYFDEVDLLITEGYKSERRPKIEVVRAALSTELMCADDPLLLAVAADTAVAIALPVFRLDDPGSIADFIEKSLLRPRS